MDFHLRAYVAAGPVSRILSVRPKTSRTIIPLGGTLLRRSSDLPEGLTRRAGTFPPREWRKFLPIWSCSVWGLPCPSDCSPGGALLPHLFTRSTVANGGLFSVVLAVTWP